ncbi:WD40/YVTN/BNR-like repeat-containing protein [Idiomarina xiamenensis]|uniref:BNR/Asp-box repeat-containing protein n=1 Tax=Idiomarina xiamenensis 10-D-4 TaxID=740709 RepID=K2JTZ3_9GAMM|nr:YCF48-related protein [Idiomarina xiamenensis]EKE86916.1 BNR/Asp-box repeat-containing protein [Idiomarina xiamenensis 10-D-4]
MRKLNKVSYILAVMCLGGAAHTAVALQQAPLTANAASETSPQSQQYDVIYAASPASTLASSNVLLDLQQADGYRLAVGDWGNVLRQTEVGGDWQKAQVDTSVLLTAVTSVAEQAWAVGHHGVIIYSSDGGQHWQRQLDGFQLFDLEAAELKQRIAHLQSELEQAAEDDAGDLQFALEDAQFLLENIDLARQESGPVKPLLDVYAMDAERIFAVGAYNTFLYSADGGRNWQSIAGRLENSGGFHLNAMTGQGDTLFIVGEAGQLFRSDDAGQTWQTLNSPYNGSFFGTHVDEQGRWWLYGLRGHAYVSSDNGDSFLKIATGTDANLSGGLSLATGYTLLVGNSGVMSKVTADNSSNPDVIEHSSGSVLTDALSNDEGFVLVGRNGIQHYRVQNKQ